jgi:hypothetical protein
MDIKEMRCKNLSWIYLASELEAEAGSCGHCNKPSDFHKWRETFYCLGGYWIVKKTLIREIRFINYRINRSQGQSCKK